VRGGVKKDLTAKYAKDFFVGTSNHTKIFAYFAQLLAFFAVKKDLTAKCAKVYAKYAKMCFLH